jgi:hypothetical protein
MMGVGALLAASAALAACDSEPTQPSARGSRSAPTPPRAETVRNCRTAIYGDLAPTVRKDAVTVGPLTLLVVEGERRAAVEPSGAVKVLALIQTGETVTVVVPEGERRRLSLLYDFKAGPQRPLRLSDGTSSARFSACRRSEEWGPGRSYPDAEETQFNGGFFVRGAHCAMLEAWIDGRTDPLRFALGFGTRDRPCAAERALHEAETGTTF